MAPKSIRERPEGISKRRIATKSRSLASKPDLTATALSAASVSPQTRETHTYIFFWGGILSNWHQGSPPFLGSRCLEIMLPRLDGLGISHPGHDSVSTSLLAAHAFTCGEQWMMAVKAWLFERSTELGEQPVDLQIEESTQDKIGRKEFEEVRRAVMCEEALPNSDLHKDTLYAVLRTSAPREQKALGRMVEGFDDAVWTKASTCVVVAACVARAELDPALDSLYQKGATKRFVEGSPKDKIWGVGLKWDNPRIDNEANWKGENRLGKCHDEAALLIRTAAQNRVPQAEV